MPTLFRTAWFMVFLLMPVALLNYLDRQLLAAMKFSVMESIPSLGLAENKDERWGIMLGQFKWVYAFLSPVGGYVADRFGRRLTICGSLFLWSLVTWWTGQATTYSDLLWARSLMGISEAFYIPAALALISEYHSAKTKSRAIGLHQMAIYSGVIVGGFGGHVADSPDLGWRFAFEVCGIVGMLYAIPLLFLIRDKQQLAVPPRLQQLSPWTSLKTLLSNYSFVLLVLCFTLPALAAWIVRDWMPAILKQQFQIGQAKAGIAATLYWQLSAIVGAFVGGFLADSWMHQTVRGRIYVSAIGMGFIVPAIFGVGNANSLSMAIMFLILFGLGWGFFDGNNMPILSQIVRPEFRATGYGLMNFVSISCGGLADWLFGRLQDQQMPLNLIFSFFAIAAILSIILVLFIKPNPEIINADRTS